MGESKTMSQRLIEAGDTIRKQELELQAAALLLAAAQHNSTEDASHVARRQFTAMAERSLEADGRDPMKKMCKHEADWSSIRWMVNSEREATFSIICGRCKHEGIMRLQADDTTRRVEW